MKVSDVTKTKTGYEAFELTPQARSTLAKLFPPKYPEFIGHHITHMFGVPMSHASSYGDTVDFEVIGYADDGEGLEALVVRPRVSRLSRPDGKIYHITWSLDRSKGMKPMMSNALVARGFQPVSPPITIQTRFEFF